MIRSIKIYSMENPSRKDILKLTVQPKLNDCRNQKNLSTNFNFAYVFRPIYYISRVFGFMPFKIIYNSKSDAQEPKMGAFDMIWFLISISVYLLAIDTKQVWDVQLKNNGSNTLSISTKALSIVELIFGIIGIGMDLCNRFKLINILGKFTIFDCEVNRSNIVDKLLSLPNVFFSNFRCQILIFVLIIEKIVNGLGCFAQYSKQYIYY